MAKRIRSIKPEIIEDAKTANLSHEAFRLFISMITMADDHGAMHADSRLLNAQVFWATPATGGLAGVDAAVDELTAAGLILLYEVREQRYAQIVGWNKHQKVDHPGKPRVPRPEDDQAWKLPPYPTKVYFIQAETSRAIKIGVSWNPSQRLNAVQNGHHERLFLIGMVDGDVKLERELHRRFSSSRMSGEWFACTPELLETIQELNTSDGLARVVEESREELATDLGSGTRDLDQDLDLAGSREPEAKRTRSKPKRTLPDDWQPNESHISRARSAGLDVNREAEKFRNHAAQNDRKCADWDAAFRNWLIGAEERKPAQRTHGAVKAGLDTQDILALADDLERRGM